MDRADVPDTLNFLSHRIIGGAIEAHRELGTGLLDSLDEAALCTEPNHAIRDGTHRRINSKALLSTQPPKPSPPRNPPSAPSA